MMTGSQAARAARASPRTNAREDEEDQGVGETKIGAATIEGLVSQPLAAQKFAA